MCSIAWQGTVYCYVDIAKKKVDTLPLAAPETVGFSREGLARIDQFMAREITAGRTPGGVIAIARNGKLVHYKAYGKLDPSQDTPMPLDAMFALASMTKVMVAVGEAWPRPV